MTRSVRGTALLIHAGLWLLTMPMPALAQPTTPAPAAAAPAPATPPQPPDLDLPLREGDVKVTGRAPSTVKAVIVRVYGGWTLEEGVAVPAKKREAIQAKADPREARTLTCQLDQPVATVGPRAVSDGKFDVTLPRRLNGGECVVVEESTNQDNAVSAIVRSVLIDLGRLRGYFSLGGAVSQNRSAFSQVDTFVGFTTDARLWGVLIEKCEGTIERAPDGDRAAGLRQAREERAAVKQGCDVDEHGELRHTRRSLTLKKSRVQINAFGEARVGFRLATTGTATPASNVATGGRPAEPAFQRPDQLAFNSDQPGFFQMGVHIPMSFVGMDWRNDGKVYSFYFGPMAKFGAVGFDNPVVLSRVVDIDLTKPATDTARFSIKSEETRRGAQPFNGLGVRVGIFGYDLLGQELRHRQIANDPVGYVDLTWGSSSGLRSYVFTRTTNAAGTVETVTIESTQPKRLAVEGRMKIPYLPALVGVDLNIRRIDRNDEPNDFRFIVAFRIDAQKALGRIFANDALSQDK